MGATKLNGEKHVCLSTAGSKMLDNAVNAKNDLLCSVLGGNEQIYDSTLRSLTMLSNQVLPMENIGSMVQSVNSLGSSLNLLCNQQKVLTSIDTMTSSTLDSITKLLQANSSFLNSNISDIAVSPLKKSLSSLANSQKVLFDSMVKMVDSGFPKKLVSNLVKNDYLNGFSFTNDSFQLSKKVEYASVINSLKVDELNYYDHVFNDGLFEGFISEDNVCINEGLVDADTILSSFIGYTFREDLNIDVSDAYDRSIIKTILMNSKLIFDYIKKINIIYQRIEKKDFFVWNRDMFELAFQMRKVVVNEDGFYLLANLLFKGIYECSGVGNNRFYEVANKYDMVEPKIIVYIKAFRNLNGHKLGDSSDDRKKIDRSIEYYERTLNKHFPNSKYDWIKIQDSIYKDIVEMLKNTFDVLNNISND